MKPIILVTIIILSLAALVHLLRLMLGWSVTVDGAAMPMWASVLGLIVAAALAVGLWREARA